MLAIIVAMVEACEVARCKSPVPGPLDMATIWTLSARLSWRLEQMGHTPLQHHVLEVVREWHTFVVGLVVRWILRMVCETSRARHSLIVGDPGTGPMWSRVSIEKPLSHQYKHQRSPEDVERGWWEIGAWARLGVATSMIHALGHSPEEVRRGARVRVAIRHRRDLNSQPRHALPRIHPFPGALALVARAWAHICRLC
jgi:hypothetical protein